MRAPSALKPDVPSFGYATFLSINATSIWGGIYPYLPAFCQTSLTTIVFYTVQIAVFWLAFCAAMAFTWARPGLSRGAHVLAVAAPLADNLSVAACRCLWWPRRRRRMRLRR